MVIKMAESYYDILEITENAIEEEIKRAYRKLSKKYHPDQNPGNTYAEKRFKEISEAYAVLGDADKKKKYDKERKDSTTGHTKNKSKNYGYKAEDINREFDIKNMNKNFEQFFGFHPETGNINEDKLNKNKNVKSNKIDVTDMFEKYMGFKK